MPLLDGELLIQVTGWLAAGFSLLAFTMRTMVPLRIAAIFSNLFFIAWSALAGLTPPLVLHLLLLPFNLYRLAEIVRTTRQLKTARSTPITAKMLVPFAGRKRFASGTSVFRKGDAADRIYYVLSGHIKIEEIGVEIRQGEIFGEIAFFTSERRRTASALAVTDVEVLMLGEEEFTRLYYQSPAFSFQLIELITRRLVENARRSNPQAPDNDSSENASLDDPTFLQVASSGTSQPRIGTNR